MEPLLVIGYDENDKKFESGLTLELNMERAAAWLEEVKERTFTHFSFVQFDHCYWSGRKEDLTRGGQDGS